MRRLIYVIAFTGRFEEMREFYEQGLDLPVRHSERDWVEFDTAGASLALQRMDDPSRQGTMMRFEADDLDHALMDLSERGIEPEGKVVNFARGRLATLEDADGNLITLLEPSTPVPSGAGLRITSLILNVIDMVAATNFYRDRFGLTALIQSPWWTEFDTGATRLSLHPRVAPNDDLRHNAQPIVVGLSAPDLEELSEELGERGVAFSGGPVEQRYGRFAEVEDPDGNVVLYRESGPRHAPSVEEITAAFEDDAPTHAAMRPAGKLRAKKTSRVALKPDYKPAKSPKPARKRVSKPRRAAPKVRGEGPDGARRTPIHSSDPERVKTRPAAGHLKKAARRTLDRKKKAVAAASRTKPLKRASARRVRRGK